jgi:hypothetical protein
LTKIHHPQGVESTNIKTSHGSVRGVYRSASTRRGPLWAESRTNYWDMQCCQLEELKYQPQGV